MIFLSFLILNRPSTHFPSFFCRDLVVVLMWHVVVIVFVRCAIVLSRHDVCLLASWCSVYLCEEYSYEQNIFNQRQ